MRFSAIASFFFKEVWAVSSRFYLEKCCSFIGFVTKILRGINYQTFSDF